MGCLNLSLVMNPNRCPLWTISPPCKPEPPTRFALSALFFGESEIFSSVEDAVGRDKPNETLPRSRDLTFGSCDPIAPMCLQGAPGKDFNWFSSAPVSPTLPSFGPPMEIPSVEINLPATECFGFFPNSFPFDGNNMGTSPTYTHPNPSQHASPPVGTVHPPASLMTEILKRIQVRIFKPAFPVPLLVLTMYSSALRWLPGLDLQTIDVSDMTVLGESFGWLNSEWVFLQHRSTIIKGCIEWDTTNQQRNALMLCGIDYGLGRILDKFATSFFQYHLPLSKVVLWRERMMALRAVFHF